MSHVDIRKITSLEYMSAVVTTETMFSWDQRPKALGAIDSNDLDEDLHSQPARVHSPTCHGGWGKAGTRF